MSDLADAQRFYKAGRFDESERLGRLVLSREPDNADALNVLAMSLLITGRWDESLPMLQRVVQIKPNYVGAQNNLAFLLLNRRDFAAAELRARKAIALSPALAVAHVTLGRALAEQGRKDEGAQSLRQALLLDAKNIDAMYWLAFIADDAQKFDVACDYLSRVLQIQPDHLPSIYLLALGQHKQGLLSEALATYARGVKLAPHDSALHSSMLFAMTYHPTISPRQLFDDLQKWVKIHAEPVRAEMIPVQASDPQRTLRIGYVSPYFQEHSVAFFLEPILEHRDRQKFSVVLYSDVEYPDAVTQRFQKLADEWRDTRSMTDAAMAELVRKDRVDILVDLTQHSGGSRLLVFARKPAPVQICYLGYPNTTGLAAIDYRLSDSFLDPIGEDESLSAEKIARLPESYFCYRPPADAPAVSPDPPSAKNGFITFVSQNALVKLNDRCLVTWARVLNEVPGSRLVIKAEGCGSHAARTRIAAMFQTGGIDVSRIEFRNHTPLRNLMGELNDADIALDTFPYNGGTTTCHILWMGVPVVSLAGEMPVHRMGLSVLNQVGLSDLLATSDDQFVKIAVALARDVGRLRELRKNLRATMQKSPLMNAAKFSASLEEIYRQMWRAACERS